MRDEEQARKGETTAGPRRRDALAAGTDRRHRYKRVQVPACDEDWTRDLAYAVGLLATDGGLTGGKTVTLVSSDVDLLETYRACLKTDAPIFFNWNCHRVQITNVDFFRWLESIGVTPRKSLTIGAVEVPERFFLDFTRGLLDGDGSVRNSIVVPNPKRYPHHHYQRLRVEFHSASPAHLTWLQGQLRCLLQLDGWFGINQKRDRSTMFVLRYSKHESIALLTRLYEDPAAPRLDRKWRRWRDFCEKGKPTRMWSRRSGAIGLTRAPQERLGRKAHEGSSPSSGTDQRNPQRPERVVGE